ncbi:MAG: class I SAM-dependent methyltransferase [Thermoleophilia bacterium]
MSEHEDRAPAPEPWSPEDEARRPWSPEDEAEARLLIFNDDDPEAFERSGRADAERLGRFFGPGDAVLDLGCGIGRVARYVAPEARELWAVDVSPTMLDYITRRLADRPNLRTVRCEGTRAPGVPDGAIDFAYSLLVLQHMPREDAFALLVDLRRMVRDGGRVFLTFPNLLSDEYLEGFLQYVRAGEVANPVRARVYTPQEVERLLPAAGFEVEDLDPTVEIDVLARASGAPLL